MISGTQSCVSEVLLATHSLAMSTAVEGTATCTISGGTGGSGESTA